METISKSSDLLARLRSVTLEDKLQLSDFWPEEKTAETVDEVPYQSDRLNNFLSSLNDTSSSRNSGSSRKFESKSTLQSEYTSLADRDSEAASGSSLFGSSSFENQENPFVKMSRKGSRLTSGLSKKLGSWLKNTSVFGILGLVCGGSLTAWSLLAGSGSHSMTALGLSLTISGLLMLVLAGICQTALHTSGQT